MSAEAGGVTAGRWVTGVTMLRGDAAWAMTGSALGMDAGWLAH